MNILYIDHYAGSPDMGMEFRPYYLAREWIKMGHQVTIVAGDYSHLRTENRKLKKDFQKEILDGICYCWVKTGTYEGNGVRRAFTMFRFVGKLWMNARRIAEVMKPDVVITSSTYPLDTYAGQRIAKISGAKLIHEVHDMWPITPIEINGMSRYHPFIVVLQLAENSFCRKSDYVVSLLPNADEYLMVHGMEREKFVTIPNGIVLEEWKEKEGLPDEAGRLMSCIREKHKFILCFFGSHTKSYALEYLIEAVKSFSYEELGLVFVGNGNDKERLKELSQDYRNIYFLDPVPKKCIPSLVETVDGIYVGAANNRMFRFGICMNKLFDAMMSGKPILYAVNAPNNFIKEFGCGISVKAEDAEALKKGIKELLDKTEEERQYMGEKGRKAVLEYFNYEKLAERFIEVFKR